MQRHIKLTKRHIQAVKLTLPKIPERACPKYMDWLTPANAADTKEAISIVSVLSRLTLCASFATRRRKMVDNKAIEPGSDEVDLMLKIR